MLRNPLGMHLGGSRTFNDTTLGTHPSTGTVPMDPKEGNCTGNGFVPKETIPGSDLSLHFEGL